MARVKARRQRKGFVVELVRPLAAVVCMLCPHQHARMCFGAFPRTCTSLCTYTHATPKMREEPPRVRFMLGETPRGHETVLYSVTHRCSGLGAFSGYRHERAKHKNKNAPCRAATCFAIAHHAMSHLTFRALTRNTSVVNTPRRASWLSPPHGATIAPSNLASVRGHRHIQTQNCRHHHALALRRYCGACPVTCSAEEGHLQLGGEKSHAHMLATPMARIQPQPCCSVSPSMHCLARSTACTTGGHALYAVPHGAALQQRLRGMVVAEARRGVVQGLLK